MRAARRQGVLGVVRRVTRPSPRVRARAPPVQHLLRGGYKRGLHAFQGGRRHHGRFGTHEEVKGGGGRGKATARESWRRRFGACFMLTMPRSSRNQSLEQRQPQCRPVDRGRPAHTQRMVQLPEVHPRTVRPIERSPRAQNPETKSRGTRGNAVRLRHMEPAHVPLRSAAPSPPQVLDSLHRLAKAQSCQPPDYLSGHAYQDGK